MNLGRLEVSELNSTIAPSSAGADVREALKDFAPLIAGVGPFGAVFGALAVDFGLSFSEVVVASATIFAGASQYAMLELIGQNVPAWAIVVSVFAINFRHVLYSASVGRHLEEYSITQKILAFFWLSDIQFALAETRYRERHHISRIYYFTLAVALYCVWLGSNMLGALFGSLIEDPARYGLDFILPIYFISLVVGFRKSANFAIILGVSAIVALLVWKFVGTPWHITIGGIAGLIIAALLAKPKNTPPSHSDVEAAPANSTQSAEDAP